MRILSFAGYPYGIQLQYKGNMNCILDIDSISLYKFYRLYKYYISEVNPISEGIG